MRSKEVFDKHLYHLINQHESRQQKAIVAVAVGWLVSLGILGGLVYVAVHFLSKVW